MHKNKTNTEDIGLLYTQISLDILYTVIILHCVLTGGGSLVGSVSAPQAALQHILSWEKNFPFPLIQEEHVVRYWRKNSGRLAHEQCGLVTDLPNMTSAVYHGCKQAWGNRNQ